MIPRKSYTSADTQKKDYQFLRLIACSVVNGYVLFEETALS